MDRFSDTGKGRYVITESVFSMGPIKITDMSREALQEPEDKFFVKAAQLAPKVYFRITDNWLEMAVRFVSETHNIRSLKDKISRKIVAQFKAEGLQIASTTIEIVKVPPIVVNPQ